MNAYYQINGRNDFDCDFIQTGVITTIDPSKFYYIKFLILGLYYEFEY